MVFKASRNHGWILMQKNDFVAYVITTFKALLYSAKFSRRIIFKVFTASSRTMKMKDSGGGGGHFCKFL